MTDEKKPRLYMLSTCVWCRKTKKLLDELGVDYEKYVMDRLPAADKKVRVAEVREATGRTAFPTIIFEGGVIVGYNPAAIKEAFEV
jgi:glutaredoxin-like protein NrdH